MAQVEFSPDELDGFAAVLDGLDASLDALSRYADVTCRAVDDMGDLREPLDGLAQAHAQVLRDSQSGLGRTAHLLGQAAREYRARDVDAATSLDRLRGSSSAPGYAATGGTGPGGADVPPLPIPEFHRHERLAGTEERLAEYTDLWHRLTTDNLRALVTGPLTGRVERLSWLAAAYATLGTGTAAVLDEIGAGIPTWRTPAGAEFDGHLRHWRAGLSGVAELDHAVATELTRVSATWARCTERVLDLADELLDGPLPRLRALVYPDRSLKIWLVPAQTQEIYSELRRGLALLADIGTDLAKVERAGTAMADQLGQWRGACESLLPSAGRRA
ncbi:hypothetical protein Lfu02_32280 [Longispora fulva]|uniref:Uncharacterized protein n=1 Tax=Longispora fulva TaxID=619741 RepID=A0A8J7GKK1_9ACTN|nr:hypothetical protein [Longispora fulva]MBG6139360.1 hypothetical protein [Longispora fulva]GIG58856.1 hypothetical protein Lfu02_32280 [Longispora fulva]